MSEWEMIKFEDALNDITREAKKIKKEDYLKTGLYPIIDQGKEYVGGYGNDSDGIFKNTPAIVFGDHTRILKYVDEPLFIGADGVKLLKINRNDLNTKFVFYYLKSCKVIDTGYNRHFKWLREFEIPLPPLNIQEKISEILDRMNAIIEERKSQIEKLDLLVKSRFVEMFGEGKYQTVKLEKICDFITKGTTPPINKIFGKPFKSSVPYIKVYNLSDIGELRFAQEPQYIAADVHNSMLARSKVYPNDVLMNIVGLPLGKFALVPDEYTEWNINQAIAIFRGRDSVVPIYLMYAMMQPNVLRPFIERAVGIRQINLSLKQCRELEIPLPPLPLQKKFADFVRQVDKSKFEIQKGLKQLELQYNALMQRYFG